MVIFMQHILHYFGYHGAEAMQTLNVIETLNEKYGLFGVLFIVAVTPAVCEEIFFRGLLLSGLRQKYSIKSCMLIQALMFNNEGHSSFSFTRKQIRKKRSVEADDSLIIYLLMLPLYFFISTKLQTSGDLGASILFSQWSLFFGLSMIFLIYTKTSIRHSLSFKNPGPANLIYSLLLAPGCYAMVIFMQHILHYFGYHGAEAMQTLNVIETLNEKYGLFGVLFIVAVTPAVCEEIFFRGLLLSGLRQKYSLKSCMLIQALMFGIIHFSLFRFAHTAVMGALLTFVLMRSGSIYCSILMHAIFNSMSCLAWYYRINEDQNSLDPYIYYIAVYAILSIGLFFLIKPRGAEEAVPSKSIN